MNSSFFSLNLKITMKQTYLTKSDFKIAEDCPTKLYYKKSGYLNVKDIDEYMKLLSQGGYMVGKMAQLLHPDGIEVFAGDKDEDLVKSLKDTQEYLKKEKVTLFEPSFLVENLFNRVDILIKNGNEIEIIEVKSKSYDSSIGKEYFRKNKSDWKEYFDDIAFQIYVLKRGFPKANLKAFFMLPDKAKKTKIEGLAGLFKLREDELEKGNYIVDFTGDIEKLREEDILHKVNVDEEVNELIPLIEGNINLLSKSISNGLQRVQNQINKDCKKCQFKDYLSGNKDGFKECWGELADVHPHVLDLYRMGAIGGNKNPYVNELINQGKVSLFDMPMEKLTKINGIRQKIQIENTKANTEWISNDFKEIIQSYKYPLYFIDFETSRSAIPFHKGMRPYENVAFQWSCHKIIEPGAEPIHKDWLNLEDKFPNFEFAENLMDCVGDNGTVFVWSNHENIILRDIYNQMEAYGCSNESLRLWLNTTAKTSDEDESRLVDMCKLTFDHYFHPEMKGSTSIKYVLPSVWKNNSYLHEIPWLKEYFKKEGNQILSPYKVLEKIEVAGRSEVVQEGTGAMRAYQDMQFGINADKPEVKKAWSEILKQYCKLDTMAMVIIWLHWNYLVSEKR